MKSMRQMQDEMLAKARFDGGYPRVVLMPFGIVALANNEEEYEALRKESENAINFFAACLMVVVVATLAGFGWLIFFELQ